MICGKQVILCFFIEVLQAKVRYLVESLVMDQVPFQGFLLWIDF